MQNIKNIIFDLGGVLLNIDYKKTEKAFIDLGVANFAELYSQQKASPLFEQLETGTITNQEFYKALNSVAKMDKGDTEMENAWCAMLGHFDKEVLMWLEEIGFRYKTYLFSNTNRIHHAAFQRLFKQQIGRDNFDEYFVKAWYSHELGWRKPYPEAYMKLLAIEQLNPEETLFIDDSEVNIIGAQQAGLHTIWLKPPQTVLDLDL